LFNKQPPGLIHILIYETRLRKVLSGTSTIAKNIVRSVTKKKGFIGLTPGSQDGLGLSHREASEAAAVDVDNLVADDKTTVPIKKI
jgi:hypothetical protein